MLNLLFEFLKNEINRFLSTEDTTTKVIYPDLGSDPPNFEEGHLHLLLVNIEEEPIMRKPDRFLQFDENGKSRHAFPALRLNIYFLVSARWSDYPTALQNLSGVLRFFQSHPVFTPKSHPSLPEGMEKFIVELSPLTYSQQNEIWSGLKTICLPSVCYKAQLMIFDTRTVRTEGIVEEVDVS